MRIKQIKIEWFRGAADTVSLDLQSKSMAVYGANASGKSSFIDAIEFMMNGGKIGHLTHEYSGRHQEKGIINSKKPEDRETKLEIVLNDDSSLATVIKSDGSYNNTSKATVDISTWNYRRTVLRQDEVADFINARKGDKYSTLLPLLGLSSLETAAENVRQLIKSVQSQSNIDTLKRAHATAEIKRRETFESKEDADIEVIIQALHAKYCPEDQSTLNPIERCTKLITAINERISALDEDKQQHIIVSTVGNLDLSANITVIRQENGTLAQSTDKLIEEKLNVIQAASDWAGKSELEGEIDCPACGRSIPAASFNAHIAIEQERLSSVITAFETRKVAIGSLCDNLTTAKLNLEKTDVQPWREKQLKLIHSEKYEYLTELKIQNIRKTCTEGDLKDIEEKVVPLIRLARKSTKDAPPAITELLDDKKNGDDGKSVFEDQVNKADIDRASDLINFLGSLEEKIRQEIRTQSQKVIKEITTDIQDMWVLLHPDTEIEDVKLYVPARTDKAIDIGLKFHGIEQDSPRLTLSEGYRNSLGLCIFLAMAKQEADKDRPLFLDDVVVSLDRNHRGMIVEVLDKIFSGRQVVILTHDRDWYTELRHQLDGENWRFKTLLPYENPAIGIRWSAKTSTFDDARVHLKEAPDSAGNTARKIMDIELAIIAERLQIRLPYLRGDRNDRRMAHDFLERFIADGKKCFQKKRNGDYGIHTEAIGALDKVDQLILSWGNKASHSFDVVRPEAKKLIDVCEKLLEFFKCPLCGKALWFSDAQRSEWVQCQCSNLRWRYGKA